MAKYIKKEMPDINKSGTTKVYYRMQRHETLDFGEFIEQCHNCHQFSTPSTIRSTMIAVCEQLATELAKGNNVKIDGLGTFHARLGLNSYNPGREMDTFEEGTQRRNAMSLGVTGVGFKADKELVRNVNGKCKLERGSEERIRKQKYTKEERIERAISYLRKNVFMHVRDYAVLNGMSYSMAYRELKNGLTGETGVITSRGSKSARAYYLEPKEPES
jgi:predicted histone-like DNA-binding protein